MNGVRYFQPTWKKISFGIANDTLLLLIGTLTLFTNKNPLKAIYERY